MARRWAAENREPAGWRRHSLVSCCRIALRLPATRMKHLILGCAVAAATPVLAQAADPFEITNANRFSLGARIRMNFKAKFLTTRPSLAPPTGGPNDTSGAGYVRRDRSGNAGGLPGNWGYNDASQAVGDAIEYHKIESDT